MGKDKSKKKKGVMTKKNEHIRLITRQLAGAGGGFVDRQ